MQVKLDIELEDAPNLWLWLMHHGYIDTAVDLTTTAGRAFDDMRLAADTDTVD